MSPIPGKKRGRKPSKTPTKVRATITIDPVLKSDIEAVTENFSQFLEDAGREKLKRVKRAKK